MQSKRNKKQETLVSKQQQQQKKKYTQMHASNEIVSDNAFLRSIWIIDSHVS